jgi:NADPH:quinone reductase-like Zn-dependent oxidoreductase
VQAIVIEDGQLVWRERSDPEPGESELLVAVRAAGVNGADLAQRQGVYPAPPGWPADIPGLEMAGEVVTAGSRVTKFVAGDRVMALVGGGAQAQLATVDETHALPVPAAMAWPEAGGFMEAFATAFDALFAQAGIGMGDRLLVTGAAGGVGSAAVQMAALAGARVVASTRHAAQKAALEELGAADVIAPGEEAAYGPFDVVLELVGAASLPSALRQLAPLGRAVVIGVGSGAEVELDLRLLMGRRGRISASQLRARSRAEKAALITVLGARTLALLGSGRLRVPVGVTFPLEDAAAAYERFGAGGKLGKIVLVT